MNALTFHVHVLQLLAPLLILTAGHSLPRAATLIFLYLAAYFTLPMWLRASQAMAITPTSALHVIGVTLSACTRATLARISLFFSILFRTNQAHSTPEHTENRQKHATRSPTRTREPASKKNPLSPSSSKNRIKFLGANHPEGGGGVDGTLGLSRSDFEASRDRPLILRFTAQPRQHSPGQRRLPAVLPANSSSGCVFQSDDFSGRMAVWIKGLPTSPPDLFEVCPPHCAFVCCILPRTTVSTPCLSYQVFGKYERQCTPESQQMDVCMMMKKRKWSVLHF